MGKAVDRNGQRSCKEIWELRQHIVLWAAEEV